MSGLPYNGNLPPGVRERDIPGCGPDMQECDKCGFIYDFNRYDECPNCGEEREEE